MAKKLLKNKSELFAKHLMADDHLAGSSFSKLFRIISSSSIHDITFVRNEAALASLSGTRPKSFRAFRPVWITDVCCFL